MSIHFQSEIIETMLLLYHHSFKFLVEILSGRILFKVYKFEKIITSKLLNNLEARVNISRHLDFK